MSSLIPQSSPTRRHALAFECVTSHFGVGADFQKSGHFRLFGSGDFIILGAGGRVSAGPRGAPPCSGALFYTAGR